MEQENVQEDLIKRYLAGTATAEEIAMVESWHLNDLQQSNSAPSAQNISKTHLRMRRQLTGHIGMGSGRRMVLKIAAAAAVIAGLSFGTYVLLNRTATDSHLTTYTHKEFTQGDAISGNKAILTLGNGQQVVVTGLPAGKIENQDQSAIQKTEDGTLIYKGNHVQKPGAVVYNTLTVPRGGGTHELRLADGTLAVLDAGSSIRFPVAFNGPKRSVLVTGQVYLEVVHNNRQPFSVRVNNQTIEDLGTHFNINGFDGETKVTLLEGSIRVNQVLVKPGQQAIVENSGLVNIRKNISEAEVMAWKHHLFKFGENTSLQTIMNQVGRWYNMEVEYKGKGKDYHFGGEIPRYSKLSDVLKILAYSGVRFTVNGNKITVYQ